MAKKLDLLLHELCVIVIENLDNPQGYATLSINKKEEIKALFQVQLSTERERVIKIIDEKIFSYEQEIKIISDRAIINEDNPSEKMYECEYWDISAKLNVLEEIKKSIEEK